MTDGEDQFQSPQQRIKALEAQLKEAQQRAELFEAIVDVLRQDYGITVVKKRSGKSLRKNAPKS